MGHCHTPAQLDSSRAIHESGDGIGVADPPFHSARVNPAESSAGVDQIRLAPANRSGAARWLMLFLVQIYRAFFSPFFGAACKFHPSCSKYAQEAIERWGARRGAWLALKRLGRCRPFTKGGFDPVPDLPTENSDARIEEAHPSEVTR